MSYFSGSAAHLFVFRRPGSWDHAEFHSGQVRRVAGSLINGWWWLYSPPGSRRAILDGCIDDKLWLNFTPAKTILLYFQAACPKKLGIVLKVLRYKVAGNCV